MTIERLFRTAGTVHVEQEVRFAPRHYMRLVRARDSWPSSDPRHDTPYRYIADESELELAREWKMIVYYGPCMLQDGPFYFVTGANAELLYFVSGDKAQESAWIWNQI